MPHQDCKPERSTPDGGGDGGEGLNSVPNQSKLTLRSQSPTTKVTSCAIQAVQAARTASPPPAKQADEAGDAQAGREHGRCFQPA